MLLFEWKKLFHDHCDGWYTAEYLERNLCSPFETFYDAKGLQLYPDISIDETAFNNFAWETRKIVPSKMIEALFYSGSKNESAYECGFITDMINNGLKDSVLINPRPFLVREENCRKYIVIDEYIKNAYKREFKGKDFISYNDIKADCYLDEAPEFEV